MEALERLGFTGFVSNKSFLPFVFGARGGTWTRTPWRALEPESSESANSTTRAYQKTKKQRKQNKSHAPNAICRKSNVQRATTAHRRATSRTNRARTLRSPGRNRHCNGILTSGLRRLLENYNTDNLNLSITAHPFLDINFYHRPPVNEISVFNLKRETQA